MLLQVFQLFQFHKGAIKTLNPAATVDFAVGFQFHKGAIKTCFGE